jgi:hypothetical protein
MRALLLPALFCLPFAVALGLRLSGWTPPGYVNYGRLILPPRPVGDMALHTPDGRWMRLGDFRGTWTLIYLAGRPCDELCRRSLHALRQVHAAQGGEMARIRRVWVAGGQTAAVWKEMASRYPGLTVISGPRESVAVLARLLPPSGAGRIYLADPLGNLVLSYPEGCDPAGMHKDLARLLKYSWVG